MLELLLEPLEAVAPLLDERRLVPEPQHPAQHARPDLAAAGHDRVHQRAASSSAPAASANVSTLSVSWSIAVCVGQTTFIPCCA